MFAGPCKRSTLLLTALNQVPMRLLITRSLCFLFICTSLCLFPAFGQKMTKLTMKQKDGSLNRPFVESKDGRHLYAAINTSSTGAKLDRFVVLDQQFETVFENPFEGRYYSLSTPEFPILELEDRIHYFFLEKTDEQTIVRRRTYDKSYNLTEDKELIAFDGDLGVIARKGNPSGQLYFFPDHVSSDKKNNFSIENYTDVSVFTSTDRKNTGKLVGDQITFYAYHGDDIQKHEFTVDEISASKWYLVSAYNLGDVIWFAFPMRKEEVSLGCYDLKQRRFTLAKDQDEPFWFKMRSIEDRASFWSRITLVQGSLIILQEAETTELIDEGTPGISLSKLTAPSNEQTKILVEKIEVPIDQEIISSDLQDYKLRKGHTKVYPSDHITFPVIWGTIEGKIVVLAAQYHTKHGKVRNSSDRTTQFQAYHYAAFHVIAIDLENRTSTFEKRERKYMGRAHRFGPASFVRNPVPLAGINPGNLYTGGDVLTYSYEANSLSAKNAVGYLRIDESGKIIEEGTVQEVGNMGGEYTPSVQILERGGKILRNYQLRNYQIWKTTFFYQEG